MKLQKGNFLHMSVILFTRGGVHPLADTPRQTPPSRHPLPETATAADGTKPTGMHSCILILLHCERVVQITIYNGLNVEI